MSGPTWLPPKTLGSPERSEPQVSPSGPAFYRPPMKAAVEARPKYGSYPQNGAGANVMAPRYMASGPTGGGVSRKEDPGLTAFRPLSPQSGDHYYPPPHPSKEEHCSWASHGPSYEHQQNRGPEKPSSHHTNIDAEIDSLTCMLADLDSHPSNSRSQTQIYDNVPYNKPISGERYKPAPQPAGLSQGRSSGMYPTHYQTQYHPSPQYPSEPTVSGSQLEYPYPPPHKPYPQPVPASYTTASTPTGPRFSVQVKTAQPVTYSQTGRQAEQAYAPPPPRQQATQPQDRSQAYPETGSAQQPGWYPPPPAPVQEHEAGPAYRGSAAVPGPRAAQAPLPKRGPDNLPSSSHGPGCAPSTGALPRPEEELDRLTKKLVYDMNHPPAEEYFGRCARCGDNVLGDGSGCIAMEQVFHVDCFTCITCHARLRGKPFYALEKKSYCENCYISTLERCSKCSNPILDRILRAMGKAYHPRCFTCVVCGCCLDGVPFTVDAGSQIHCIEDFHRKFAPRCSVCGQAIMPEPGQEETVRIVALDRSFHVNCYVCEECGLLLSSEGEGRGCYPLDGHILCKSCSAHRIQDLSAKISTDC